MKKFLWLFLAAGGLLACKPESDRILIKLIKGQKYTQHLVNKMSATQTIMGKERTTSTISDAVCKYEVVDVRDSIFTLKVTYESMSAKVIVNGDSTVATKNPISSILDGFKGKSYLMKISNTGSVIETIGADSLLLDLINKVPNFPEALKATFAKQLSDSYGDKGIKRQAELGMNMYPQKPVKVGDSWAVSHKGGDNMVAPQIDAVFKLDKITRSEYLISGKFKLKIGSDSSSQLSSGPIQYDLSGTMNSTNKIDKKTGMVTETKADSDVSGVLKMKEGAAALGETTVPMHIKSEMVITNSLND